jgi:tetratricopeptide (TPR) repeat protein
MFAAWVFSVGLLQYRIDPIRGAEISQAVLKAQGPTEARQGATGNREERRRFEERSNRLATARDDFQQEHNASAALVWPKSVFADDYPWTHQLQLGRSMADRGRYREARRAFEQAREQAEQAGSLSGVATALNNLGAVYSQLHDIPAAERYYRRSAAIWKDTGDTINALGPTTNLAGIYVSRRQYSAAESLLKEALELAGRKLGSEHPVTAAILGYLGRLAFERRDFDRAAALGRRSLEILRNQNMPNYPEIATGLGNLGAIYRAQRDFDESSRLFAEAVATLEQLHDPKNAAWIRALHDLAGVESDLGHYEKAEALLKSALSLAQETLGSAHPRLARILYHYADVLRKMGRRPEARELAARATGIEQQSARDDGSGYTVDFKSLSGVR